MQNLVSAPLPKMALTQQSARTLRANHFGVGRNTNGGISHEVALAASKTSKTDELTDRNGATAGVALVPKHPFARPFRERHRLRYPDIVRCSCC